MFFSSYQEEIQHVSPSKDYSLSTKANNLTVEISTAIALVYIYIYIYVEGKQNEMEGSLLGSGSPVGFRTPVRLLHSPLDKYH